MYFIIVELSPFVEYELMHSASEPLLELIIDGVAANY